MSYIPLYIESFNTGLETDKSSFQIINDAFTVLQDSYIWRGRVRRKQGYSQIGRATRILTSQSLGNTSGSPHVGNIKTTLSLEANAQIEQGSIIISVAGGGAENYTEPATPDGTLTGDGGGSGTINYTTGAFSITSGAGWGAGQAITIDFDYYPALPIMGIYTREIPNINAEETLCFDTVYAYEWDSTNRRFEEMDPTAGQTWNGTDSDFFWAYNYRSNATVAPNVLMVTNNNKSGTPDPIYVYDDGAVPGAKWITFNPPINGTGDELHQAAILIPYKGRVVALNTWEGATLATSVNAPQRARWCQIGDFIETLPISGSQAWREDVPGRGGYIDAPTSEHIVSARFVRDTLVVGFEKSHWRLRDTGNPILPFSWERINDEFGIESRFSTIKFNNMQIGVGATGIVGCDALNVKRIDEKIPDDVFSIQNQNEGPLRIHGIRDFDKELMYWSFPNSNINRKFPNELFVYNYRDNTWSFFKDSFTTFGYFQEFNDTAWQDLTITWAEADFAWVSASLQALYPDVIGGNQHGFICKLQKQSRNDSAFAITSIASGTPGIITIPNHNLQTGQFIRFTGILGTSSSLNNRNFRVSYSSDNTISLAEYNPSTGNFDSVSIAGGTTYLGGGEAAILHDVRIRTKKFNSLKLGESVALGYIDFQTNVTSVGQFNVDIFVDNNTSDPANVNDSFFNTTVGTFLYDNDIVSQDKVIHRFFCHIEGRLLQFEINLSDVQLSDIDIHDSDLQLFSMIIWSERGGRLS